MDPLTVFITSLVLAALPEDATGDDRKRALDFVRDRALRWGPIYAARMAEPWPDPDQILEDLWDKEHDESYSNRLDDDWAEANDLLGGKDEELWKRLVSGYPSVGSEGLRALVRYGDASVSLRSPIGDDLPFVTSPFGKRKHPVTGQASFHEGVDLRAASGTSVLAPAGGTVAWLTSNATCGWGVAIDHSPTLRTVYCHLSRRDVKKGSQVEAGQQIGLSGGAKGHPGAGRSTAAHLHFMVQTRKNNRSDWEAVDPMPFLKAQAQAQAQESWLDWFSSFWPFSSEEENPPTTDHRPPTPTAHVLAGPGVVFTLTAPDGTEFGPGEVPAGAYELLVSGKSPQPVEIEDGQTYRVSSIGRMFPG